MFFSKSIDEIFITTLVLYLLFLELGLIASLQTIQPELFVRQLTLGTPSDVPVPKNINSFFILFIK